MTHIVETSKIYTFIAIVLVNGNIVKPLKMMGTTFLEILENGIHFLVLIGIGVWL
jgi:hypothetical protein